MKRAERRAHMERVKNRMAKILRRWGMATPKAVGKRAQTPQMCSCMGCGNKRPHEGPSIQEKKHRSDD